MAGGPVHVERTGGVREDQGRFSGAEVGAVSGVAGDRGADPADGAGAELAGVEAVAGRGGAGGGATGAGEAGGVSTSRLIPDFRSCIGILRVVGSGAGRGIVGFGYHVGGAGWRLIAYA